MILYTIDVDNEQKRQGNKRLIKRLLIALLVVVVIAFVILYLENFGVFPGGYLNKPRVKSFLEKNYPEYSFTVDFNAFSKDSNAYVYDCYYIDDAGEKKDFKMYAKRFSVTDDGFFDAFLRNTEKEEEGNKLLAEMIDAKWQDLASDITAEWSCSIEIPKSDTQTDIKELLKSYDGSTRIEVTLHGKSVSFEDYKKIGTKVVTAIRTAGFSNIPSFVQIYYYRDSDNMQYESQIEGYLLAFNDSYIEEKDGVHMYVEVPKDVATRVKIFSVVQYIMLAAIVIAIVVPVSFKIYKITSKKIKKKKREQNAQDSDI